MKKWILTIVIFLAGAALVTVGVCLGEPQSVLSKAVRICLECIGIG
ncbi:MAG: CD1871A family CXXC motif-containing protein [Eubacteriales bacterium]|nr:CD1871A family CXXC motif-containing protein [Eubacteriales bacterium]